ncbi:MAG: gamma-glutamylcyclotransferase family protein [Pseudomonadota bacterium]
MGLTAHHRLATYGTLAPGCSNNHEVSALSGTWRSGHVFGNLVASGWGAAEGFPGLCIDPRGERVDVLVLESPELPDHWERLDLFEGDEYERVERPLLRMHLGHNALILVAFEQIEAFPMIR